MKSVDTAVPELEIVVTGKVVPITGLAVAPAEENLLVVPTDVTPVPLPTVDAMLVELGKA